VFLSYRKSRGPENIRPHAGHDKNELHRITLCVIPAHDQGFADEETALIWSGRRSRRLPFDMQAPALGKLRLLNQARALSDLRVPPGNRLEALKGERGNIRSGSMASGESALRGGKDVQPMSKSSTTTNVDWLPNPTPGEILLEDFLRPLGLSQTALAVAVRVPPRRINEIVLGKRAVTADTDLRLTRYFGLTPGFFLGLQADHDLMARRRELGPDLEAIKPRAA
jgi:addiction module HigA family antidote